MVQQIYWEDIKTGSKITSLPKIATTQMLVKWAGSSGDFHPLHYDHAFAVSWEMGRPIIHGMLKGAWLAQLLTDWMGEQGILKKYSFQCRAIDYPRTMKTLAEPQEGETWWCKGEITKKYVEGNEHCVDCDIRVENGKGEKTTLGQATIVLPSRS